MGIQALPMDQYQLNVGPVQDLAVSPGAALGLGRLYIEGGHTDCAIATVAVLAENSCDSSPPNQQRHP